PHRRTQEPDRNSSPLMGKWREAPMGPPIYGEVARKRRWGRPTESLGLQTLLHEGDVHPAVELVGRVADRAHVVETELRIEGQPRPVVLGDARHDRPVAKTPRMFDQVLQKPTPDTAAVVDRVD